MTTDIYTTLMERHQAMQDQLANQPDALQTETILQFLEEARAAGAMMGDVRQREQLRAVLRHWGGIIFDRRGDYPATQLVPFEGQYVSERPSDDVSEPTTEPQRQWVMVGGILLFILVLLLITTLLLPQISDAFSQISDVLDDSTVTVDPSPTHTSTPPPTATERPTPDEEEMSESPPDSDGDGLYDDEEEDRGTNPFAEDSDRDGLFDEEEVYFWETDPLNFDTDDDGLLDGEEIELGTDPLIADTDEDGLLDGEDRAPNQASTPTPMPTDTPVPPTETPTPQTAVPHTVQAGETLDDIAEQYNVTVEQLTELNGLSAEESLQAGQQLFVPLNPGFFVPELVIKIPLVNLRSGPGIEYTIIAYPERGTFAAILGQTADPTWYLVEIQDGQGTRGWLSAAVVRLLYPTRPEVIPPVATVPPTPAP